VRAGHYSKVVVEIKVSQSGSAQLFWTTASAPGTSEAASAHVATTADGQFHPYAFEVSKNEYWGGCLTGMRLDPAVAEGVTMEIRAIKIE